MATYIPNATTTSQPTESQTVESAALEFRTLKTQVVTNDNVITASLAVETAARIAADTQEASTRHSADAAIIDSFAPILDAWVAANFINFDLGFIIDDVPSANVFDFGSIAA